MDQFERPQSRLEWHTKGYEDDPGDVADSKSFAKERQYGPRQAIEQRQVKTRSARRASLQDRRRFAQICPLVGAQIESKLMIRGRFSPP